MAASMVAIKSYSMVAVVLVKKPVMVRKVASAACSFESRFSRVQISLVLREGHLLMDLPIKISPKIVFDCAPDLSGYWEETI
jgi:hypothetical protein